MGTITGFPRVVLIGKNTIEKLPFLIEDLNVSGKIMVLADDITKDIAGERVAEVIRAKMEIVKGSAMEEIERIGKRKSDFIIAVGGGKVIDTGKLIAFRKNIEFMSFPTALSHDGIVSSRASVTVMGKLESTDAKPPIAVVADLDILKNCPYRLITSGAADIISNRSALFDWKLAKDNYSEPAAGMSELAFNIVSDNLERIKNREESGLENLLWALILSGNSMSIAGSSRPASGSEHMFSHALDMICSKRGIQPALHGEQCGIGCILMSYLQGQNWKKIKNLLERLGAPVTLKDLKIEENLVIEALVKAKDMRDRYTILNEKPLNKRKASEMLKNTGIV